MEGKEKTRENRLRRKLDRMGYRLLKARRRDPDAVDYGMYVIADVQTNGIVFGTWDNTDWYQLTLDDVEEWIRGDEEPKRAKKGGKK
jgi:hypothetical protein